MYTHTRAGWGQLHLVGTSYLYCGHSHKRGVICRLICTQKHTVGTSETVLIREVSLFQRLICTQKYTVGTSETVLIREVSLFQRRGSTVGLLEL